MHKFISMLYGFHVIHYLDIRPDYRPSNVIKCDKFINDVMYMIRRYRNTAEYRYVLK